MEDSEVWAIALHEIGVDFILLDPPFPAVAFSPWSAAVDSTTPFTGSQSFPLLS